MINYGDRPDVVRTAYDEIFTAYDGRHAARSGERYMKHIDQGLEVLDLLNASDATMAAFCLHPLLQGDKEVATHLAGLSYTMRKWPSVVPLAMEYRSQANAWLSDKVSNIMVGDKKMVVYEGEPTAGPLADVRHMLIADKVQNYMDFCRHHYGTHERSAELNGYFITWLDELGVSTEQLTGLRKFRLEASAFTDEIVLMNYEETYDTSFERMIRVDPDGVRFLVQNFYEAGDP